MYKYFHSIFFILLIFVIFLTGFINEIAYQTSLLEFESSQSKTFQSFSNRNYISNVGVNIQAVEEEK